MFGLFKTRDLRRHPRLSCHWGVTVSIGRSAHPAFVMNISRGGCHVRPVNAGLFLQNHNAVLTVGGTDLRATLVGRSGRTWHLRFLQPLSRDAFDDLFARMGRTKAEETVAADETDADLAEVPALAWLRR